MVNVKFFAMLKGIAGVDTVEYDLSGSLTITVGELKKRIVADIPSLAEALGSRSILVSVNQEVAEDKVIIEDGEEVAFLPPYSGG